MNTLYKVVLIISLIGCLNWGLVGIFDFNLVTYLFGEKTLITRIVYILVLLSGLTQIGLLFKKLD